MNYKVHIIFMANPFSFSQGVFLKKKEPATPIHQEIRILKLSIPTPFIFACALYCVLCVIRRRINILQIPNDMNIQAIFAHI